MSYGRGFGKVILLNEHFVLYSVPSIVSALGAYTTAEVSVGSGEGFDITDKRPATPGYKTEKYDQQVESTKLIFKAMDIDLAKNHFDIKLGGDLLCTSGVGASAASCTAIARSLSEHFDMKLTDERINELAFEGEKGYHGTPSGVDNTASTFGGLIWFEKGDVPKFEKLKIKKPVEIVMGNTGLTTNTVEAVGNVKKFREGYPKRFDMIREKALKISHEGKTALELYELDTFGKLMNDAHELLQRVGVSHERLDKLVDIARKNGALGAKMTGSGMGGYMVALTPGKDLQEKVADSIQSAGFDAITTTIG